MAVGVRLRSAFSSDMGRRRTNNEDRYFVDADRGIFAVIDGVAAMRRASMRPIPRLR